MIVRRRPPGREEGRERPVLRSGPLSPGRLAERRSWPLAALAGSAALAALIVLAVAILGGRADRPAPPMLPATTAVLAAPAGPTPSGPAPAGPAAPSGPAVEDKAAGRLAGGADPARLLPYNIAPPYWIDDGLTFGPGNALRTHLAGLEGPDRDAVCFDRAGLLWACGLQARAALSNLTAGRKLACIPTEPISGVVTARCTADGVDIGRSLVAQGFARPKAGQGDPEAAAARAAERGLWNGGWRIRP